MDLILLAQTLFLSQLDPAYLTETEVVATHGRVMGLHDHDHDRVLRAVARQFHASPVHSDRRMADCLVVAVGYLCEDPDTDRFLAQIMEDAR